MSERTQKPEAPLLRSFADLQNWVGTYLDKHVASDQGCSCGWDPSEFDSTPEERPTHQEHLDASFAHEVADVLPSHTRDVAYGQIYDAYFGLTEDNEHLQVQYDTAQSWCADARRRIKEAVAADNPVDAINDLRQWMAALDTWEKHLGHE